MKKIENNNINIFIKMASDKLNIKPISIRMIIYNFRLSRFRKRILSGSPCFDLLWQMADFIKLADKIYFYNNTQNNSEYGLYSSSKYSENQNGFITNDATNKIKITVKLINESNNKRVLLEISNNGNASEHMEFCNDDWACVHNRYNEILLDQIIKIINYRIIKLFDYCCER